MAQSTYTYELNDEQQNILLLIMEGGNYRKRTVPYSLMSIEGDGFNCTLYAKEKHGKRKCCIQGGKAEDFVLFVLEPQVLGAVSLGYEDVLDPDRDKPHGGSDESGKGDYFGPLVTACCYVDEKLAAALRDAGVKDCKQMSDKAVLTVGAKVRQLLGPQRYSVVKIGPATYNRLYAKIKNINRLLAWGHARVIENLLELCPECPRMLSDKFGSELLIRRALMEKGRTIKLDQQVRAESDVAVAAASILAREYFLRQMSKLSEALGVELPRGGGPQVKVVGRQLLEKYGPEIFASCAKLHFKTYNELLNEGH